MTIAYITDHDAIENVIISWLRTHVTLNDRVIVMNQAIVRPALPYATIQYIADGVMEGHDAEDLIFNIATNRLDIVTHGPRRMTVQVTLYTVPGAEDVAGRSARIRMNTGIAVLRSPSIKNSFAAAGLAFLRVLSQPRAADDQLGDRWERRMQCDVEFGYTAVVTDTGLTGGVEFIEFLDGGKIVEKNDGIKVTFLE